MPQFQGGLLAFLPFDFYAIKKEYTLSPSLFFFFTSSSFSFPPSSHPVRRNGGDVGCGSSFSPLFPIILSWFFLFPPPTFGLTLRDREELFEPEISSSPSPPFFSWRLSFSRLPPFSSFPRINKGASGGPFFSPFSQALCFFLFFLFPSHDRRSFIPACRGNFLPFFSFFPLP